MFSRKNRTFYLLLSVLLSLNVFFFLPLILNLPDFMMDDFLLFHIIDKNPSSIILVNPGDIVHLSVRPLTYFSFWLDHIVFNFSSFQMKAETLFIHLCLVSVFLFFVYDVLNYLKIKINPYKLGLAALIFTTHTICVWWMIWIQQKNELLMLLFYVLSLYSVFLFIKYSKNRFLFIAILFYIISFLFKQQSLHIPFIIFILFFLFKERLTAKQKTGLIYFASAGLLLMIAYLTVNFLYYESTSLLSFTSLWKKPLSAVSVIGLAVLPLQTDKLYNFMLEHKTIAIAVFLIFTGIFAYIFFKKDQYRKKIILALLIFAAGFFPVLSAEITLRIITTQVFWIFLFLIYAIHKIKLNNYMAYAALLAILYLNINASLRQFGDEKSLNDKRKTSIASLDTFINSDSSLKEKKIFALCSQLGTFIPYQYYYYKYNSFGRDSIRIGPVGYTFYIKNFYTDEIRNGDDILVNANIKNDTVTIIPVKNYIKLFNENNTENFKITNNIKDSTRGYNEISYRIPDKYKNYSEIYYNGKEWLKVK